MLIFLIFLFLINFENMNQLPPPPPFMPPPHMSLINPELAPKETLYVSNLNDKIKNEGKSLFEINF
jgi:hypothetical protein